MDENEFTNLLEGFVRNLRDRLPEADRQRIDSYLYGGEWALLIDELTETLLQERIPVTQEEHSNLKKLLYYFDVPIEYFDAINKRDEVLAGLNIVNAAQ
ncbi:hypothetical protein [Amycolatopsis anabasis]|uniref:hypothetical protein n=1 Tax=Amycolatopsis anabasis TaxID=1840409 RepID=UPI00131EB5EA|nr:hypothetical protein [Amycolatopsis anabasis]